LQIDNWLMYAPDNAYCVVHAVTPALKLIRFNNRLFECSSAELNPIDINDKIISVAGFKGASPEFEKKVYRNISIFLIKEKQSYFLFDGLKKSKGFRHVHQLQNEYFNSTTIKLPLNLFGI